MTVFTATERTEEPRLSARSIARVAPNCPENREKARCDDTGGPLPQGGKRLPGKECPDRDLADASSEAKAVGKKSLARRGALKSLVE